MPKPNPKPPAPEYQMPTIGQGWPVLWRHSEEEPPCTAFVTSVGPRAVDLMIFPPGSTRSLIKTAVRHQSDPLRKNLIGASDDGFWTHTTFGEVLLQFVESAQARTTEDPAE